jgi:hypothetical protein
MAKHRFKCQNSQCGFEGMMDAVSDTSFAKKRFLEKDKADRIAKGSSARIEQVQIRCPKCGTRWRMRADQLH